MLRHSTTKSFRKQYKLMQKRGMDITLLNDIMTKIINEEPLPAKCREHNLHGDWKGYTECYVQGDWILIYEREEGVKVVFEHTGTHSDLF